MKTAHCCTFRVFFPAIIQPSITLVLTGSKHQHDSKHEKDHWPSGNWSHWGDNIQEGGGSTSIWKTNKLRLTCQSPCWWVILSNQAMFLNLITQYFLTIKVRTTTETTLQHECFHLLDNIICPERCYPAGHHAHGGQLKPKTRERCATPRLWSGGEHLFSQVTFTKSTNILFISSVCSSLISFMSSLCLLYHWQWGQ